MDHKIKVCSVPKGSIYTIMCNEAASGSYTSYIRGNRCRTVDDFFREVSASLQFPFYFGENWAALDECLCDLEWLNFQKIFIVIDDFNLIFSGQADIRVDLQHLVTKYFALMVDYWALENRIVEVWLNN